MLYISYSPPKTSSWLSSSHVGGMLWCTFTWPHSVRAREVTRPNHSAFLYTSIWSGVSEWVSVGAHWFGTLACRLDLREDDNWSLHFHLDIADLCLSTWLSIIEAVVWAWGNPSFHPATLLLLDKPPKLAMWLGDWNHTVVVIDVLRIEKPEVYTFGCTSTLSDKLSRGDFLVLLYMLLSQYCPSITRQHRIIGSILLDHILDHIVTLSWFVWMPTLSEQIFGCCVWRLIQRKKSPCALLFMLVARQSYTPAGEGIFDCTQVWCFWRVRVKESQCFHCGLLWVALNGLVRLFRLSKLPLWSQSMAVLHPSPLLPW